MKYNLTAINTRDSERYMDVVFNSMVELMAFVTAHYKETWSSLVIIVLPYSG